MGLPARFVASDGSPVCLNIKCHGDLFIHHIFLQGVYMDNVD